MIRGVLSAYGICLEIGMMQITKKIQRKMKHIIL